MTAFGCAGGAAEIAGDAVDGAGAEENAAVVENGVLEDNGEAASRSPYGAEGEVAAVTLRAPEAASVRSRATERRRYCLAASWRMATARAPLTHEEKPQGRPQATRHGRMVARMKTRDGVMTLGFSPRTHGCGVV